MLFLAVPRAIASQLSSVLNLMIVCNANSGLTLSDLSEPLNVLRKFPLINIDERAPNLSEASVRT